MTKKFNKKLCSILIASCFLFIAFASGNDKNKKSEVKTDYSNTDAYKSGEASGQLAKTLGGSSYCSEEIAEEQGKCIDQICKDAWCEGYNAGYRGK